MAQGQQALKHPPAVVPLKAAQLGALPRFFYGADATEFQPKWRGGARRSGPLRGDHHGADNLVDQKAGERFQA